MDLTYGKYLRVDQLLELQQPQSDPQEHDEMLFIVIHQVYELWFKQILHEFEKLRKELRAGKTWTSSKTLTRILTILKTMVAQIDVLETMTPLEFESFRSFLENASGFQSVQFREIEILCGLRSPHFLKAHRNESEDISRLKQRLKEQTLWECFCIYLEKKGYKITAPERIHEQGLLYDSNPENQKVILHVMKNDPEAALLCEKFVDFDEGMQEWRYRHVKMVERTIGSKTGTGGSEGAGYLRKTLHRRIFPDLWEMRSKI